MTKSEIERLAVLETQMCNVEEKVDRIEGKLDKFISAADNRYASKVTERLVYGLVGTVLLAVLYVILGHVGIAS